MKRHTRILLIAGALLIPLLLCQPVIATAADDSEPQCWAVIVGVSNYQQITDIGGPVQDVQELTNLLGPVWGYDHINVLTDSQASKSAIRSAINWLDNKEDSNDTVLFYFSGHGDEGGWIAPYDAYYENTWISSSELSSWLRLLESDNMTVILDTCYAGAFNNSLSDDGRVILAASQSNETSWSAKFYGEWHGVFSYYLIEAIDYFFFSDTNDDYELSAEEIFNYAQGETIYETSDFDSTQHPVITDRYPGQLSLLMMVAFTTEPGIPSNIDIILLDDQSLVSSSDEFILAPGSTHEASAFELIEVGDDTRYIFSSWDDGYNQASRVISQGGEYTACYQAMYLLVIESDYGSPQGQGWYDAGSTANISIASVEGADTRYIFAGWSGAFSGTSQAATLTINSPTTVTAEWNTEYLLTLNSEYGSPTGGGWYQEGSTANISIEQSQGFLIRYIFTGWSGSYSGNEPSITINMDSAKTITAQWKTDYLYLYILIGGVAVLITIAIVVVRLRRR